MEPLSCSHLGNLGDACSGLDANLAEALDTAILARLKYGPEAKPLLGEILRVSGEFTRFDREETTTPEGLPVIYPPTPASPETLRKLADAAEQRERTAEKGAHDDGSPFALLEKGLPSSSLNS